MTTFQRLVLQGLGIIIHLLEHGFGYHRNYGDHPELDGFAVEVWKGDVAKALED